MKLFARRMPDSKRPVTDLLYDLEQYQARQQVYLCAIYALLYCIKEFSLDLTEIHADVFKTRMDALVAAFRDDDKPTRLERTFADYRDIILAYIAREKDYLQDREGEFKTIIEVLSTGLTSLGEDNQDFNRQLYERSAQLEKLTYLEDIRKLKEALRQEVQSMQTQVRAKQARDSERLQALSQEVSTLRGDIEKAQEASLRDGLTGAYNRLACDMQIHRFLERHAVAPTVCTMLILDIDNFKHINDTYGHPVGDRVIMALVQRCTAMIRKDDFLGRYGGEEFVILLPGASLRQGLKRARAICKEVAGARYAIDEHHPHETLSFTVSIGVSTLQRGDTVETFVARSDKALYTAKHEGKNRAVSATANA